MEKLSGDENFLKKDIILNHKYNFFQQFFIIGIDPKIMYIINIICKRVILDGRYRNSKKYKIG